ncbi:ABC transporter ATP-binding protein [Acuticoccus sp. M5D2P5]|uniref:ABC transporter ATP-binding protein n=1 Tax=Acuticoccus kalidii TaxID=2910977 RepID=UPI001F307C8E|nr:ABC transporter ATP-binding protein [Acuticoccus kalidii]MCF3934045.1 ABC transporter ATP-binding protein [Acuticoccus kalidii]
MASINVRNLSKRFGAVTVIEDLSLDVEDGEFLVLLGPSGCGKSTLLRILAGLEAVSDGEIEIGETRVEEMAPGDRDIAFVFQSYALYPHLTVRRNIAFPLLMKRFRWWMHLPLIGGLAKRRIEKSPEVADTVEDVGRILGLGPLMDRLPRTLSGGQRQRVAVGRAMVRQPAVFLMDEPLSNLDAKLRTSMRAEIARLHARLGGTFVYVTHDQVEAMTMGTRIALMRGGKLQQVGTPRALFQEPANTFVARFVGTPPMNLIDAAFSDGMLRIGQAKLPWHGESRGPVIVGVRPGSFTIHTEAAPDRIAGKVSLVEHLGTHSIVAIRLDDANVLFDDDQDDSSIMVQIDGYSELSINEPVHVSIDPHEITFFDHETGERTATSSVPLGAATV